MPTVNTRPAALTQAVVLIGLALAGCSREHATPGMGPCAGARTSCAAAAAAPGLRQVRHGHRIVRTRWIERTNKESGAPDIGIQAEWAPFSERR
jgi:hypothetical protein